MADLGNEVAELRQAGLGGEPVDVTGAPEEPEQAVQLDDGLSAGGFDRAHGLGRPGWLALHYSPRPGGLDPDDADVVGHDIVKLAGDAHPLCEHGLAGIFLALGLKFDGLVRQLVLTVPQ